MSFELIWSPKDLAILNAILDAKAVFPIDGLPAKIIKSDF